MKLGFVSFFADISSEMLYPITPIFLTTVLGASMASVGAIEGVAEAIASLLKTYSGAWSDKISKRRPFIITGYLLAAVSKPMIGLAGSWGDVLIARGVDRTGKGIRTAPRDALLAESVDDKNQGAAFGLHRGMDTLGAAIGPLAAIYLLTAYQDNLRPLYYWAIVPGLLSVALLFWVKEKPARASQTKWQNPLSSVRQIDKPFRRYLIAWGLFSLANSSDVFLLMKAKSLGHSTQTVILMYCAYNLIYAISSPYLGVLSDKLGRRKLMIFGLGVFALVYLGFGFAQETWQIWVLFLTYGLYMGATDGVGKALALELSPGKPKATTLGLLGTVTGFCTIFASVFAGMIWDSLGGAWPFVYGVLGAVFALLILSGESTSQAAKPESAES
ncbi:MAG: MFS transporter [Bdellovibrionaceae bacterium]|nr:MFS transporter [Pseudobdellovibrionaceae bacterium]